MTQYNLHDIHLTIKNFLLDKGRVAENLQKRVFLLFYYIFYFPIEEPFQPYSDSDDDKRIRSAENRAIRARRRPRNHPHQFRQLPLAPSLSFLLLLLCFPCKGSTRISPFVPTGERHSAQICATDVSSIGSNAAPPPQLHPAAANRLRHRHSAE